MVDNEGAGGLSFGDGHASGQVRFYFGTRLICISVGDRRFGPLHYRDTGNGCAGLRMWWIGELTLYRFSSCWTTSRDMVQGGWLLQWRTRTLLWSGPAWPRRWLRQHWRIGRNA